MNNIRPDACVALEGVLRDGMLIASGSFGLSGIPERLIECAPGETPGEVREKTTARFET